jgi:hypothetical protein
LVEIILIPNPGGEEVDLGWRNDGDPFDCLFDYDGSVV